VEQRLGRGERQGNENESIEVFRYVTENTFDAYLYQTLENKQRFISQIMTSKSPVRSCEDVDEVTLSFAEIKALCAGNPLIKEKIDLDVSVAKLKALKANHNNEQYRLEDNILKYFPESIRKTENRIKGYESDLNHLNAIENMPSKAAHGSSGALSPMTIMGTEITDKETAGKAIIEACKELKFSNQTLDIGEYKGFALSLSYDSFGKTFHLELKRDMSYTATLGSDPHGNITRIENLLGNVEKVLENSQSQLEALQSQLETAKDELGKPFPNEGELTTKIARLAELNILLNIEGKKEVTQAVDAPAIAADKPPKSIYGKMKYYRDMEKSTKETGGRPPKSRSDAEL
jgi:hypothetical protein